MKWKTEKENPHAYLYPSGRWLCKLWLCKLIRRLLPLTKLSAGIATVCLGAVAPLAATTSVVSDRTLKLIADSDGSHSDEDIVFGFNGSASNFEEVMRLNEKGMLSLEHHRTIHYGDDYGGSNYPWSLYYTPAIPLLHGSVSTKVVKPSSEWSSPDVDPAHHFELLLRGTGYEFYPEKGRTFLRFNLGGGSHMFTAMEIFVPRVSHPANVTEHDAVRSNQEKIPRIAMGFYEGGHEAVEALDVNGAIRIGGSFGDHAGTIRYHNGAFEGRTSSSWVNLGQNASSINSFTHSVNFSRGLQLGNTDSTVLGALRFHDGDFEGYDGAGWVSLTESELTRSTRTDHSTDDIYLDDGHFGGDVSLTAEESKLVFGASGREGEIQDNYLVNSLYAPADNAEHFPVPAVPDGHSNFSTDDDGSSGGVALVADGLPRLTVKGNGNTYIHKRLSIGLGAHVPGTSLTVGGAVHIGPDNLLPTEFDYDDEFENYLLWVENGIVSEDFAIANVDNWSDHVFDEDYDLMSLENVAEHIEASGHLPGVPSASEVAENGYTVHGMTRILLEKIEELTLHTIEQDKAIRELKAQLKGSAKKRSTRSLFSRLR